MDKSIVFFQLVVPSITAVVRPVTVLQAKMIFSLKRAPSYCSDRVGGFYYLSNVRNEIIFRTLMDYITDYLVSQ